MNADSTRTKLFLADSRGRFVKKTFCLRAFLHETSVSLRGFLFWLLLRSLPSLYSILMGGRDVFSGDIKASAFALDAIYFLSARL